MSDFFNTLGDVISQKISTGENKLHSLDIARDGTKVPYGRLGDFANKFDRSAERTYLEEGFFKTDLYNQKVKQLEILFQEPEVTVLVKKRAFNSLSENYRTDLLSKDERLFVRATKFLFQNKCKQIAAYERLSKIDNIATKIGEVDYHLLPAIFAATDALNVVFGGSSGFDKFKNIVNRVRTITNLSDEKIYTTWTTNVLNSFRTDLGEGTGVIEFTTGFNIGTTTTVNFGGGKFDINFTNPYQLMRITHNDIEQAIADATNVFFGNSLFQLSIDTLNKSIDDNKKLLNERRIRRGANPINFIVNPDTFLGRRVQAIIDNSGIEIKFEGSVLNVDIDPAYLAFGNTPPGVSIFQPGELIGNDGLNNVEENLFKQIVRAIFNSIQINQNSRTTARSHNAQNNALRKKMRQHYGSKLIIQPMDAVHIFVNSKTKIDDKVLGGLQDSFGGVGFLQTANKALMGIQDLLSVNRDSIDKAIFVGSDFPNWLWRIMRNQFTIDKSGTQIFAGLVNNSTSHYDSGGNFTVNINGDDNTSYFKFGVVNYKPALEVWNGSLYDPITPFDIKFDSVTGFQKEDVPQLLQENNELFKSAFVKYKNGVYVGKKPSINNFIQDAEKVQNTSFRRVFYDPDGMVYKWKEGIGALVMFGNNYQETPDSNTSVPALTGDPFAGQDVMNVLSLLITGEPYNFATFYKAASQFDNFGRDPTTGADPSTSYFKNLQSDIKKRNLLYGNFVPFKKLSMDQENYKRVLNNQIRAEGFDRELNDLLNQRADLNDRISWLTNFGNATGLSVEANNLQAKIDNELNPKIDAKIQQINDELNKIDKPISLVGNDVSLDYNPALPSGDKNKLHDIYNTNKDLRRRLNYLTRRLSWKVRANEDVNFFIVDDTYDKDYDIQAFEKSFTNPSLFRSDYVTVSEKISQIKTLLDLEVFADSQGHIQVRPPQYNKMPSSVFYRMLRLKSEFDIQLYPQFIEELYVNQIESVLSKIEVLEDEIRMYGLALSKSTDKNIEDFLSSQRNLGLNTVLAGHFKFISDEDTGLTSRLVLKDLSQVNDPDAALDTFSSGLNALDSITTQSKLNNIFSLTSRATALKDLSSSKKTVSQVLTDNEVKTRSDKISARLQTKTGQQFDLTQLFPNSQKLLGGARISSVDLLKIMDEISTRLAERQRIIKIASSAIKNAKEGLDILQNKDNIGNKLLTQGLLNNKEIPQGFEHLIEDESYDDYGPGSGKRYVIKNHSIKSFSTTEKAPTFSAIEVTGRFGDNFVSNLPNDFQGFKDNGGNALTTATAVDYDMWRMYGIRLPQSVDAPFLTDPQTQCAPFAVALLNKARKEVFNGSVEMVGNEYMQPGEVVYLEEQDMLFYVETVQHRISYGKSFSTSLELAYGHMPGEYIPTYLDAVGKILYKNKEITNIVNVRQNNVNNEEHLGTIIGDPNTSNLSDGNLSDGVFSNENREVLNGILQSAEAVFTTTNANYQPYLELRIFYASQGQFASVSGIASDIAEEVKSFLLGRNNSLNEAFKIKSNNNWLSNFENFIVIKSVDSDDPEEFRSPSSSSFSLARAAISKKSTRNISNTIAIDNVIYNYVVDCWIYFDKKV